jgi:hypothetical protein
MGRRERDATQHARIVGRRSVSDDGVPAEPRNRGRRTTAVHINLNDISDLALGTSLAMCTTHAPRHGSGSRRRRLRPLHRDAAYPGSEKALI